ncbi:hypothetical protein ACHAQA_000131 [Verticillium albo-atrum]
MTSIKATLQSQCWEKEEYLVSTNPSLLPVPTLVNIFDSSEFYWAKTLSPSAMKEMIENSLCFGLYGKRQADTSGESCNHVGLELIGFARCVTDFITFIYFTDVWVDPAQQGHGLGSWLVECVHETVEAMPDLRRSLLFTADWSRSVPFYEKLMDMKLIESRRGEGLAIMERKGRGHPSYGRDGTGYN